LWKHNKGLKHTSKLIVETQ